MEKESKQLISRKEKNLIVMRKVIICVYMPFVCVCPCLSVERNKQVCYWNMNNNNNNNRRLMITVRAAMGTWWGVVKNGVYHSNWIWRTISIVFFWAALVCINIYDFIIFVLAPPGAVILMGGWSSIENESINNINWWLFKWISFPSFFLSREWECSGGWSQMLVCIVLMLTKLTSVDPSRSRKLATF